MLTERKWNLETVPYLIVGLFLSVYLGYVVMQLTGVGGPLDQTGGAGKLPFWIINAVFVHGALLAMIWAFLKVNKIGWLEAFGFRNGTVARVVGWGTLGAAAVLPVGWALSKLFTLLIQRAGGKAEAQAAVQIMQEQPALAVQVFLGFTTIVVAPTVEEMFFRGILYPSVKQAGYPRVALYSVAALFAIYHGNLMVFVPLLALALVLTAVYEATDNLLAPILLHAWFNVANYLVIVCQVDLDGYFKWVEKLLP